MDADETRRCFGCHTTASTTANRFDPTHVTPGFTCEACHNPHQQLDPDAASYNQNCLSCHTASLAAKPTHDRPGAACPVSTKNCITCHMPQVELPSMHAPFTDHRIRIVREGQPYAN
jgi:hypothetical protein